MNAEQIHANTDLAAVYFNRRESYFLVVAVAKKGYGSIEVGQPVRIGAAEFEGKIGLALSQALDSFQSNSPRDAIPRPPAEHRAFRKNHLSVTVERRRSSGELKVMPLHRLQAGYVGRKEEEIVLSAQEVGQRIATVLQGAFDIAT